MNYFILVGIIFFLTACAGKPPFLEYTVAQVAIKSARKVHSAKNAVTYWNKALHFYHKAEKKFQNRDYTSAQGYFRESIRWAEKAENISRFKMSQGEGI